jgi:hypothetical protein
VHNIRRLKFIILTIVIVAAGLPAALFITKAEAATTESIWPNTSTPAHVNWPDSSGVEVGVKFQVALNGTLNGVRFYKGAANTGTHVGHLWALDGTKMAEVTFTNETASGWQNATFANPVSVTAGTTYVASYYAPVGQYAADNSNTPPGDPANLSNSISSASGNITALASSTPGGNGVFNYTTSANGTFPASSATNNSNYWVDVIFAPSVASNIYSTNYTPATPSSDDVNSVSVGVQFQSRVAGYINGVRFYKGSSNTGTHVGSLWTARHTLLAQATFTNETATGWQHVSFSDPVPIDANTTYTASYFAPNSHYAFTANGLANGLTNANLSALPGSTVSGGNGVFSYGITPQVPLNATTGSDYAVDINFSSTYSPPASSQPTPRTGTTGSGNILVLTDPSNHFSDNYCSAILETKGIACAATDSGNFTTSSSLSPYKTVILADGAALTSNQVSLITTWVNNGGNFIAMKPADNLKSLLGLNSRDNILSDAYIKVDNTQAPGLDIDGQTLQFHGVADKRTLVSGTRAVATLYDSSTHSTGYPAITTKTVGTGTASAWMFDLAKSVVYTREGNPGLAGQTPASSVLDNNSRVADRFALGYLDISKAAVPQADMQVSLLTNEIQTTKFPVPVKWVFPSYKPNANHPNGFLKAAFILTGDDHATANSQTLNRFASETTASAAGCVVSSWTCIRSTSYAYPAAFSDSAAKAYVNNGFEVGPHVADNGACAGNWNSQAQLDSTYTNALSAWQTSYPTISSNHTVPTERLHCYGVWKDYATVAKVEQAHGTSADTSSSCWPNTLFNVGQCMFNGSGFPQKIADSDGSLTSVRQFATQATDENTSTVSQTALNGLVTNATGASGYYGYFTVLAHLDNQTISNQTEAATLSTASANDIPVISAAQAQSFWSARNATLVSSPTYANNSISFTSSNPHLDMMLLQPTKYGTKTITGIKNGTTAVTYTTQTINGISYAVFTTNGGSYTVSYQ